DAMVAVRDGRRRRSEMSDKYPFSNHCHAVSFLCSAIKCGERYGETHDQARAQILEALSCVDREPPGLSIEDDFRRIMELANPDADKHDKLIVELKELVSWWYMKGGNDRSNEIVEESRDHVGANKMTVPEGWKLVPVDPTPEMQAAGGQAVRIDTTSINKLWTGNKVYAAMLAAAPTAPGAQQPVSDPDGLPSGLAAEAACAGP